MSFFALKISDPGSVDLVNKIKAGEAGLVIQQLNQLEGDLKIGEKIFIQLGGDRVSWDKGLIGLAEVTKAPFDKGYDSSSPRNFRIEVKMVLTLSDVIRREEFRFYVDAYDAGGIGPNTKGEQNQAIKALTDKQAYAILRAMAEKEQSLVNSVKSIFDSAVCERIFGKMSCLVEKNLTFDEAIQSHNSVDISDSADEQEKKFVEWMTKQKKTNGDSYPIESIRGYAYALRKAPEKLEGYALEKTNLFEYVDVVSIQEASAYIRQLANYDTVNHSFGNGQLSAGLSKYEQFLAETYNKSDIGELNYITGINISAERNRIIFGAPGTGKSFTLKKEANNLVSTLGASVERVTFHPDYTYSQFVGAYKPIMEGEKIRYEFVPGPFMRVYVKAMKNAMELNPRPFILIIEEINRAKVAAVFGDVFQLLDRDSSGISEYGIQTSEDVRQYLAKELDCDPSVVETIKIPDNMFIWATMNSADQGVFPMDTAFKRRWSFEYLGIDEGEEKISGKAKFMVVGLDTPIEWNSLRKALNEKMSSTEFHINEDKLMGPFFLAMNLLDSDEEGRLKNEEAFLKAFKSKVLMYLYEDAVKQRKHDFFENCDTSKYSAICTAFDDKGLAIFGSTFMK